MQPQPKPSHFLSLNTSITNALFHGLYYVATRKWVSKLHDHIGERTVKNHGPYTLPRRYVDQRQVATRFLLEHA